MEDILSLPSSGRLSRSPSMLLSMLKSLFLLLMMGIHGLLTWPFTVHIQNWHDLLVPLHKQSVILLFAIETFQQ
jgi:hypothetical protein